MPGIPFIKEFKFDYGTAMEVTPLIRRVVAHTRSHASTVDDSAQALLTFASGVTGILDTSWSTPGTSRPKTCTI